MDNEPIDVATDNDAGKEKAARTMRVIWSILTPVFALIVLFQLYEWSRGDDSLRGILSPFGMIFLGLANMFARRNKNLRTVLIAIALILVVSGLIASIIY